MVNVSSDVSGTNITTNPPPPSVDDLTHFLIVEHREQHKRKLNIILHGIGESTAEDSQFTKQDDIFSQNILIPLLPLPVPSALVRKILTNPV